MHTLHVVIDNTSADSGSAETHIANTTEGLCFSSRPQVAETASRLAAGTRVRLTDGSAAYATLDSTDRPRDGSDRYKTVQYNPVTLGRRIDLGWRRDQLRFEPLYGATITDLEIRGTRHDALIDGDIKLAVACELALDTKDPEYTAARRDVADIINARGPVAA